MDINLAFFVELFFHVLGMWWVIVPSILLGLFVGAIPGFSAANTIIILLPLTFLMEVEVGLVFMIALYCSSRLGAGIPAILVNIPGTAGAAATPLDGYPMAKQGLGAKSSFNLIRIIDYWWGFDYCFGSCDNALVGACWLLHAQC